MRGTGYGLYSSSSSERHHGHHWYHPYRRSERGYFLDDFKKAKPSTFDGEFKKLEDAKAWLLGIKKLFEMHNYSENMKAMIAIFSLKGKSNIWWEDVKCLRGIKTKELSWHEFKGLFRKKYFPERYYDSKAKELYELKMGSMTDEE